MVQKKLAKELGLFLVYFLIGLSLAACMSASSVNSKPESSKSPAPRHNSDALESVRISKSKRRSKGSQVPYEASMRGTTYTRYKRPLYDVDFIPIEARRSIPDMYFRHYGVNPTFDTQEKNVSTFSADVDTASYRLAKGFIDRGKLPDSASVRVEEFVNYFDYDYNQPKRAAFALFAEAFPSQNRKGYHILHLGLQAKKVSNVNRKPLNLVFVVDVSGSMRGTSRLGLLKRSLRYLINNLRDDDYVSIVAFNQNARVIIEPTSGRNRHLIKQSLFRLRAGGSTNAEAGIQLAYELAHQIFNSGSINRLVLVSDGVANTGLVRAKDIYQTIESEAKKGISMMTVGIGMGNYNDVLLEKLARHGQGFYSYINQMRDARELFGKKLTSSLLTLAKDVKIRVKFDSRKIARYRLLGYESRMLKNKDFKNDRKDAAEVGPGHSVTAIYEVKFRRGYRNLSKSKRYSSFGKFSVRFKRPNNSRVWQINKKLPSSIVRSYYESVSGPSKLSYLSASFAEKLRGSYWVRNLSYAKLRYMFENLPLSLKRSRKVAELGRLISRSSQIDNRQDKFESDYPIVDMTFDRVPILR